jgi:hypothetical protein
MGNVDLPQKNEAKYLCMDLNRRLTWAKHIKSKRKQLNLNETNELATCKKTNTINRKQTPPIQSSTQTHNDLWNSAMGGQPPIPTSKSSCASNRSLSNPF